MSDKSDVLNLNRISFLDGIAKRVPQEDVKEADREEDACAAFGYLRGIRDRAVSIEFRFRSGDSEWYPFGILGPCRFNPSVGILLRFHSDVVTLILIRGSNLDTMVSQGSVNLTDGLKRHRILYVREMGEEELRKAGKDQPTIDRIEIAECDSTEEVRLWLEKTAPVFVRR